MLSDPQWFLIVEDSWYNGTVKLIRNIPSILTLNKYKYKCLLDTVMLIYRYQYIKRIIITGVLYLIVLNCPGDLINKKVSKQIQLILKLLGIS